MLKLDKVVVVGAGPAGLYSGLLLAKQFPNAQVTVLERNPEGATYGFGVLFSDRTLTAFREADYQSFQALTDRFILWDSIAIRRNGEAIQSRGHAFAGISRVDLLDVLQTRARELGVQIKFEHEFGGVGEIEGADLVIAADGVNSKIRSSAEDHYQPKISHGKCRYIWLGAQCVLNAFTFVLRTNSDGLFRVHSYPYNSHMSTVVVECTDETWRRSGLHEATEEESLDYCQRLLDADFNGATFEANRSSWLTFPTLRNKNWRCGNVVLLGDAAHTAHFSIGSGTKLAMEDAVALARGLERRGDLQLGLIDYEMERQPIVARFQEAALESQHYFESIDRHASLPLEPFAFHLLTRSGRLHYDDLGLRDRGFVAQVDRALGNGDAVGGKFSLTPTPIFQGTSLRECTVRNRLALLLPRDAWPDLGWELQRRALAGAGVIHGGAVAISHDGRRSADSPALYTADHERELAAALQILDDDAQFLLRLDHAGPRSAFRAVNPRDLDETAMAEITAEFVDAAHRADRAGVGILQLQLGRGTLLASFLSPLINERDDHYGGSFENRARFPLQVVEAVREAWPPEKPLSIALMASDFQRGGWTNSDAVHLARQLVDNNQCDLLEPVSGQTATLARVPYGRGWLTPASDLLRNETGCPTLVDGYLTTLCEANTVLAGARADICVLTIADRDLPKKPDAQQLTRNNRSAVAVPA